MRIYKVMFGELRLENIASDDFPVWEACGWVKTETRAWIEWQEKVSSGQVR